jgi:hypothetical protein
MTKQHQHPTEEPKPSFFRKRHAKRLKRLAAQGLNRLPAAKPEYLDNDELGDRWRCHPKTAYRRMISFGAKPMKLSQRSVLFRMSDVEKLEANCS